MGPAPRRVAPRHLVRVDIEERRLGIEGRAAPLSAAVKTGKDDGDLEADATAL
jgi:hypothetical protein